MGDFPTTPEGEIAIARLRELLRGTAQRRRIAEASGVPESTLKDYFSARTVPRLDSFAAIARAVGLSPEQFFLVAPGAPERASAGSDPDVVRIPVLDVAAAAGAGRNADVVRAIDELPVPLRFVQRLAPSDADLSCLRAAGDSMAPTILDGAILVIDGHQKKPQPWRPVPRKTPRRPQPPDDIFVFNQSGDLRLKRLRDIGDGFLAIISDNHADHPIEIFKFGRDGGLAVIGKVIWWDNRL